MKKSVVQMTVEKIDQLIQIKASQITLLEELRSTLLAEKGGLRGPKRRKKENGSEKQPTED